MRWSSITKKALVKSSNEAIDQLDTELVKTEPILRLYQQLYLSIIPPRAIQQYKRIKKKELMPYGDPETEVNWDQLVLQYIRTGKIAQRIVGISEYTKKILRAAIEQAIADGLSTEQTQRLLRKSYAFNIKRARIIARTEMATAIEAGSYMGAEQLSMEGFPVKKTWSHSNITKGARDAHLYLNGETIGINEYFNVNGFRMLRPHDPSGPPSETIACRCTTNYSL